MITRVSAMTAISASVRSGVLAFGLGLAALAIPQLLDTAAAETTDAAPASTASTPSAEGSARPDPAGPRARVTRLSETRRAPAAAPPTPARTATRTPAATPWTPLPARPRYRSPESPAAAAPRPSEPLLRGVDGTYVYFTNRTDQTLAVVQVPNGGRDDPEADPRYIAPGEKSDFYGDNNGGGNMDVRLRIYSATQDDTGAWQKGDMREIITATNRWILAPYARVQMDPKRDISGIVNRYLEKEFSVNDNWFADYDLRGPFQSGQTGTYVVRLSDRVDDYKVFVIEAFKIPSGSTQDYALGPGGDKG